MGFLDKLLGRGKRAVGEGSDSPSLREEGRRQESAAHAEERAETDEERAVEERERATRERMAEEEIGEDRM